MDHSEFVEDVEAGLLDEDSMASYILHHVATPEHRRFMMHNLITVHSILNGRVEEDKVPMDKLADMTSDWNNTLNYKFIHSYSEHP